ncbi:MAG TPA: hypothetical protein VFV50_08170, partial [Bdellovibrionales bacterium]|nr:hypothetical protein [Bdellovibrionales bacterium]
AAGGELLRLLGNHEVMNAQGDVRYVHSKGFDDFGGYKGRLKAFAPGGPYARMLAEQPVAARRGGVVFVHGGLLPRYAKNGLKTLNESARLWLLRQKSGIPFALTDSEGPLWSRHFSDAQASAQCSDAEKSLSALQASAMVVAHTPQRDGINAICGGRVWRVDVGMSKAYGGSVQALEIKGGQFRVLKPAE